MAAYGRLLHFNKLRNFLSVRSSPSNSLQLFSSENNKNLDRMKPKRPQSPFFAYFNKKKMEFMEMYNGLKYVEIVRKAADKWAKLDPAEKEMYKKEYNDRFINYANELKDYEKYLLTLSEEERLQLSAMQRRLKRDLKKTVQKEMCNTLGKPVKPRSGFFLYLESQRNERDRSIRVQEWIRSMGNAWRSLPEEKRTMYLSEASALLVQYKKDLAIWREKVKEGGYDDVLIQQKTVKKDKKKE
ncbi:hypothetical protein KM043_001593 [Ampulex compressa]|nr:hypothetical protein KM043_001593 [Ampulex compressa]